MKANTMLLALASAALLAQPAVDTPFLASEIVFPLEHWHNHASMIVEAPDGDLLVCWFHGSGERGDDVVIRARLEGRADVSAPFLLADTPAYPTPTYDVSIRGSAWLMSDDLANEWHRADDYKIRPTTSAMARRVGRQRVMHVTPGDELRRPSIATRSADRRPDAHSRTAARGQAAE